MYLSKRWEHLHQDTLIINLPPLSWVKPFLRNVTSESSSSGFLTALWHKILIILLPEFLKQLMALEKYCMQTYFLRDELREAMKCSICVPHVRNCGWDQGLHILMPHERKYLKHEACFACIIFIQHDLLLSQMHEWTTRVNNLSWITFRLLNAFLN